MVVYFARNADSIVIIIFGWLIILLIDLFSVLNLWHEKISVLLQQLIVVVNKKVVKRQLISKNTGLKDDL